MVFFICRKHLKEISNKKLRDAMKYRPALHLIQYLSVNMIAPLVAFFMDAVFLAPFPLILISLLLPVIYAVVLHWSIKSVEISVGFSI